MLLWTCHGQFIMVLCLFLHPMRSTRQNVLCIQKVFFGFNYQFCLALVNEVQAKSLLSSSSVLRMNQTKYYTCKNHSAFSLSVVKYEMWEHTNNFKAHKRLIMCQTHKHHDQKLSTGKRIPISTFPLTSHAMQEGKCSSIVTQLINTEPYFQYVSRARNQSPLLAKIVQTPCSFQPFVISWKHMESY